MRWFLIFLIGASFFLAWWSAEAAETVQIECKPRSEMVAYLNDTYREKLTSIGRLTNKGIMEVYVSKSGTFSVIVTMPNSKTCLVAAGDGWQELKIQGKEI